MELTITKKIAKQGKNRILVIPKHLHPYLEEGGVVQVRIRKMPEIPLMIKTGGKNDCTN